MNIPKSCGGCKYGYTYDMSIDDLRTHCFVLNYGEDWCDFPNRIDYTSRMRGCPLPNLTEDQIKIAKEGLEKYKLQKKMLKKALDGKTKLIRKRNWSRIKKLPKKNNKGKLL